MKQAILFPGQGTQTIGMGKDFYDSFQQAKDVLMKLMMHSIIIYRI